MACALKPEQTGLMFESPACLHSAKLQRSRWDLVTAVKAKKEQTVVKGLCRKSDRETERFASGNIWCAIFRGGRVQYGMCCWLVQSQESVCLRWPSVFIQAIASMCLIYPERKMYKYFVNLR